jgi:hypothetical protein
MAMAHGRSEILHSPKKGEAPDEEPGLRIIEANARFYDDVTRSNISLADETTMWADSGSQMFP